jgi:hypothetical protein
LEGRHAKMTLVRNSMHFPRFSVGITHRKVALPNGILVSPRKMRLAKAKPG